MADAIIIPLRPNREPDDESLVKFLQERISEYKEKVNVTICQIWETEEDTEEKGEPEEFAFGKLLKYLSSLESEDVYRLAAGALWSLSRVDS